MHKATFSLGKNLVGFEVDDAGQPVVVFLQWNGNNDVDHLLTLPSEVLLGIQAPGRGLPVTISQNGHSVQITDAELRQLRDMFQAAEALLENYQGWLAEKAPHGVTVPVFREWLPQDGT